MTLISRKYIDDHDMVARYLADGLSDAERETFEAYYLENPELLQELNRTAQFKSGLMDLRESGVLEAMLKQRPWWQRAGSLAVAASLVLVSVGASIWFNQRSERPLLAASVTELGHRFQSTLQLTGSYNVQRTRTSFADATIPLPTDAAAIELRIKPEVAALPARYRVSLAVAADESTKEVTVVNVLQPASDGFVAVYLNAAKLSPALYELKIKGDVGTNAATAESVFLIEVVPASGG